MRPRPLPLLCCTLALIGSLAGCASQQISEGPSYPEDKKVLKVLDVQVLRDDTKITITNTSTRSFGQARAWVNQWWSADFPGFTPGQTVEMDLFDFKDHFGDEFRAGGFFATQNPEPLIKFEIEEPDGLVGFIVIGQ